MSKQSTKKRKAEEPVVPAGSAAVLRFQSSTGETLQQPVEVPLDVTTQQLHTLLNKLLSNDEPMTFSFFIDGEQIAADLVQHLSEFKVSVESTITVVYQPQAVFHVRPVTRCTASMPGHTENVLSVAFSPDGKELCTGSGDTTVRFWDLNTQLPKETAKGHTNWVMCIAFSPDGRYVASGGMEGAVCVWDPETAALRGKCLGHKKSVMGIAWEPAHLAWPSRRFASGGHDGSVRVWDADTRRAVMTLSGHTKPVSSVKWGGEGLIFSGGRDGAIRVWDAQDGKCVRTLQGHGHWVNTLALSSDYVLRTGPFDHRGERPEGDEEAKAAAKKRYQEATGGQPERLVSGSDDFTLFLWEPFKSTKPVTRMTGHQQLVNQVAFSPNGMWIASASFDKSVKLWNGMTGKFVTSLRGHVGPVYQVAWSADSRQLVSGSKDSTLKVGEMRAARS